MKTNLLFLCAVFSVSTYAEQPQQYRYIRIPLSEITHQFIQESGFIQDHLSNDTYAIGYLPIKRNFSVTHEVQDKILELDPIQWAHHRFDIKTLNRISEPTRNPRFPYEDFHTYETLTTELKTLSSANSLLASLQSAGKTVQGREMWYLRLTSKKSGITHKPKLLFISSMHGDEVTGKEMMIYLIRDLLSRYGQEARITNLLDTAEIFIMPSMNPDGTELSQRFNANGIDLNRNFPKLGEDPFGGSHAIETENIMELHRQNHFLTALNFHGGELCVNIPWDSKLNNQAAVFGDNSLMLELSHGYAKTNHPMQANHAANFDHGVTYGYEWYPIYGGMQDWASNSQQSTHATVEISTIKWPSASSLPEFWTDNRESLLGYLENSLYVIHAKVVNSEGELLESSVSISTATRELKYNGYVHRPTMHLNQGVTFSSPGYQTKMLEILPSLFDGSYVTVTLERNQPLL